MRSGDGEFHLRQGISGGAPVLKTLQSGQIISRSQKPGLFGRFWGDWIKIQILMPCIHGGETVFPEQLEREQRETLE